MEAWRSRNMLRDPERFAPWLSGIARNVCLRWARQQGRELTRAYATRYDADTVAFATVEGALLADGADLEVELERKELAALLDQALALLPPETRAALLAHYVEEMPLALVAERLGVRASAVAMRLQRGKLALRRVLATDLGREFGAYAGEAARGAAWEETRIWCFQCGRQRVQGRYFVAEGELLLRCPSCRANPEDIMLHTRSLEILGGVRGFRRALDRVLAWSARYYPPGLRSRVVPCIRCGCAMLLDTERPAYMPPSPLGNNLGLHHRCPGCGSDCWESLDFLLLASPEGRGFIRRHERIRTLPMYAVEAGGRPAIVARFEDVTDAGELTLVADAATFELLHAHGGGRE
jgi:RNA polymerase sigma-70 factor (ECF subfamily)